MNSGKDLSSATFSGKSDSPTRLYKRPGSLK